MITKFEIYDSKIESKTKSIFHKFVICKGVDNDYNCYKIISLSDGYWTGDAKKITFKILVFDRKGNANYSELIKMEVKKFKKTVQSKIIYQTDDINKMKDRLNYLRSAKKFNL